MPPLATRKTPANAAEAKRFMDNPPAFDRARAIAPRHRIWQAAVNPTCRQDEIRFSFARQFRGVRAQMSKRRVVSRRATDNHRQIQVDI